MAARNTTADGKAGPGDLSKDGRSVEVLAAVVDALHAQLCAVTALMASWYQAEGLPVPAVLPDPGEIGPRETEGGMTRVPRQRGHLRAV